MSESSAAARVRNATACLSAHASAETKRVDRVAALADVCRELLRDPALARPIQSQSGLSKALVRLGLETTLAPLDETFLRELRTLALRAPPLGTDHAPNLDGPEGSPVGGAFVNLAGNVFSAGAAPLVLASLLGVPVLLRTSARDDVFPLALANAINARIPGSIETVTFDHQDDEAFVAAFRWAEVAELFGSDETVVRLMELAPYPAKCNFVKRGHGMGAVLLGEHVSDEQYALLAQDVAAYDQQGCLSPRVVYAEGALEPHATRLSEALSVIGASLPRGELPEDVAIASSQWRASAAALGTLYEGPSHAVVVDAEATFPLGPTHRHLLVRPLAPGCLHAHRQHLKVVGHTGLERSMLEFLPAGLTLPLCSLGQMQRPDIRLGADHYWVGQGYVKATE